MLLSACSSTPEIVTKTQYLYPPSAYLVNCEQSKFKGTTYGEAVVFLRKVMNERDICASRITGIIQWEAELKSKAQ